MPDSTNKPLQVKHVNDYAAFVGAPSRHPLISVIDYTTVSPILHTRSQFSVYALFLRDDTLEDLTYGSSKYDYNKGTLICVAPGQIGGVEYNGNKFNIEGWALLFHPELLRGTPLDELIKSQYTFFGYQANEALHMTDEEREIFISLLKQLQRELDNKPDGYQDSIALSYIEIILKYCKRFYDRQFATRKVNNSDILARFEMLLREYFDSEKQLSDGLPTVPYFAENLFLSPNYLGDLIKRETGKTIMQHIRQFVVEKVKTKLFHGETLNNIAYELGFEYPQHLSRVFKKHTGETPTEYYDRVSKKKIN